MCTVFEILTDSNTCKNHYYNELVLFKSIENHLSLLFNARQGSLQHLPNYGLPDLQKIYQDLPDSLNWFARQIKEVIDRYEPRLNHVVVKYKARNQIEYVIYFEISAQIHNGSLLLLDTYFLADGKTVIQTVENDLL